MGKIEELEEYVESLNPVDTWGWSVKRDRVWADKSSLLYFVGEIKQQLKSSIPTQQDKVVVPELPRHIIDYLKWCERNNKTLLEVIGGARCHDADNAFWTEEERRKIAVAYATGDYTVEKEQLYEVRLPFEQWDSRSIELKTEIAVLAYDISSDETKFVNKGSKFLGSGYKTKLNEERIKLIDERYWAFAVPVEEEESK